MRRVAVTGMGIVSCIGNNTQEVLSNLREGKSGISKSEEHVNLGFRSQIYGKPDLDPEDYLDKKVRRFMGMGAAWNYISMQQASLLGYARMDIYSFRLSAYNMG